MIKIAYVVSSLKKSGPTEVLFNIISHLDNAVFSPIIITLSPEEKNSSINSFRKIEVDIIELNLSRISGLFLLKKALNASLKLHQPDLIHTQGFRPDFIVASFFKKYNFFSTIHNNPFEDYSYKLGKYPGLLIANIHKALVKKRPGSFISVSNSISRVYLSKKIQITSIQNGVDTDKFFPVPAHKKKSLRQNLNIPSDKIVFIASGRLTKSKNLHTTIRGFNEYNSGNSILLIIGDGEERVELKKFESNTVRFVSFTSSILDYYQLSDFFISSSLTEGFPMAVLEAMASGLVPVISKIEPHQEIFGNLSMPMFSPKDYMQLSKCLNEAYTNKENYRQECLKLIKNKFNSKNMSEKYQEKYMKALTIF